MQFMKYKVGVAQERDDRSVISHFATVKKKAALTRNDFETEKRDDGLSSINSV